MIKVINGLLLDVEFILVGFYLHKFGLKYTLLSVGVAIAVYCLGIILKEKIDND